MKRIIALILCTLTLISLFSCGGEMPAKTPEPATPEAATPEAQTPEETPTLEESYPKDVPCGYGSIMPWINEFNFKENLPGIEIITDRDTLEKHREAYDQKLLNEFIIGQEDPNIEAMLDYHEAAVKAFGLCDEDDFFEKNTLLLIAVPFRYIPKLTVSCQIIRDDNGTEKLMVVTNCCSNFVGGGDAFSRTVAVSIPNNIGIDSAEDIIVSW